MATSTIPAYITVSKNNDSGRFLSADGTQTAVASSDNGATGVAMTNITLSAGTWLVLTCCRFSQSANGIRRTSLSTSSGTMSANVFAGSTVATTSIAYTFVYTPYLLNLAQSTKYYLNAGQNSGGSLNVLGAIRAYRLSI